MRALVGNRLHVHGRTALGTIDARLEGRIPVLE